MSKKLPKFWYFITVAECPVCGCGYEERERQALPRPERPEDRYDFITSYDWCDV